MRSFEGGASPLESGAGAGHETVWARWAKNHHCVRRSTRNTRKLPPLGGRQGGGHGRLDAQATPTPSSRLSSLDDGLTRFHLRRGGPPRCAPVCQALNVTREVLPGTTFWNDWLNSRSRRTEWNQRETGGAEIPQTRLPLRRGVERDQASRTRSSTRCWKRANGHPGCRCPPRGDGPALQEIIAGGSGDHRCPDWRSADSVTYRPNVVNADMHPNVRDQDPPPRPSRPDEDQASGRAPRAACPEARPRPPCRWAPTRAGRPRSRASLPNGTA